MARQSFIPTDSVSVVPSDTDTMTGVFGLYVGTTGDVTVKRTSDSDAVTYTAFPGGQYIPGEVYQVLATGTTASNIIAEKA